MRIVRLGQDVDRTGRLAPEAIERTRARTGRIRGDDRGTRRRRVRMVATSATRDAANRDEFVAMVLANSGRPPEVITGAEEAELSFRGAAAGSAGRAETVLVADIGGGSTELVLRQRTAAIAQHERRVRPDDRAASARRSADRRPGRGGEHEICCGDHAAEQDVPLQGAGSFVGVAGTVTTVAAIALELPEYDAEVIHGSVISAQQVGDVTGRLLQMTHEQRAALPVMHPGRVDVIAARRTGAAHAGRRTEPPRSSSANTTSSTASP